MKCTDCKYCLQVDYGYSNWTVEGTEVYCLLNKHPNFPVDRFYKEEPELEYAGQCYFSVIGEGITLDVDREDVPHGEALSVIYTDDHELKELLDEWENKTNE